MVAVDGGLSVCVFVCWKDKRWCALCGHADGLEQRVRFTTSLVYDDDDDDDVVTATKRRANKTTHVCVHIKHAQTHMRGGCIASSDLLLRDACRQRRQAAAATQRSMSSHVVAMDDDIAPSFCVQLEK